MTTLAIMQPYFFPYLGYFQLMAAADRFVIYDDVAYIKNGWINRNRLLLNGRPHYFTLPLRGASPNKKIHEVHVQPQATWRRKMEQTFLQAYAGAPGLGLVMDLLKATLDSVTDEQTVDEYARCSLLTVHRCLGLTVQVEPTSRVYGNEHLRGQDRVIDICKREGATTYLNAPGGRSLYDEEHFSAEGISLGFIDPILSEYSQLKARDFVSGLSMLDLIANLSIGDIQAFVKRDVGRSLH